MWYALIALYVVGFVVTMILGYMEINRKIMENDISPGEETGCYTAWWIISIAWPISWVGMGIIFIINLIHHGLIRLTGG